jgi:hypothetical protein
MATVLEAATHFRQMKAGLEQAVLAGRDTEIAWRMVIGAYMLQEALILQAGAKEKFDARTAR